MMLPGLSKTLLTVDLIPSTSWWDNARSKLTKAEWDCLRKKTYKQAGYRCEICGASGLQQGAKWPVECHEIWNYDQDARVQKLVRLIALCPRCHQVKHFGRTQLLGKEKEALEHLMRVNQWPKEDAILHIKQAFLTWKERSQIDWALNLDILKE
jgi:hypothetical protein